MSTPGMDFPRPKSDLGGGPASGDQARFFLGKVRAASSIVSRGELKRQLPDKGALCNTKFQTHDAGSHWNFGLALRRMAAEVLPTRSAAEPRAGICVSAVQLH